MKHVWKEGDECSVIFKSYNKDWSGFDGQRINCQILQIKRNIAMVLPYCCGHEHMFLIENLLPYKNSPLVKR